MAKKGVLVGGRSENQRTTLGRQRSIGDEGAMIELYSSDGRMSSLLVNEDLETVSILLDREDLVWLARAALEASLLAPSAGDE